MWIDENTFTSSCDSVLGLAHTGDHHPLDTTLTRACFGLVHTTFTSARACFGLADHIIHINTDQLPSAAELQTKPRKNIRNSVDNLAEEQTREQVAQSHRKQRNPPADPTTTSYQPHAANSSNPISSMQ